MSYSSVHAFKGMEKRVVFITDIDLSKGDQARDLLYTALTRATERVCLLAGSDDAKRLTGWLLEDAAR
jgi:superfamily I DNA/RNA helicase